MKFDRSKVKPFKHGAVNRNEAGVVQNFSDKGKCRCCHQFGRQLRLNAKRRYCKTCKPLIDAAPKDLQEIFKPHQSSVSSSSTQLHSINVTDGSAAADEVVTDDAAEKEESGEEDSVFLCQLTSEKDMIDVDEHPWFEDAADEASHGKYASLKNNEAARRPAGPKHKDCRWCYSRSRSLLQELLPAIDIYDAARSYR